MSDEEVDRIAVLGAGTMGHGIAEVAAIAGFDVTMRDVEADLVEEGYERIDWSLEKLVEHDRLTEAAADAALERVDTSVAMADAVDDADVVIEAVPERLDVKKAVFAEAGDSAPDEAIFATNTSSLSITEIAAETDRPTRVGGMHFFNPPVRMDLVEVIAGEETAEATVDRIAGLAEAMDKTAVRVARDTPGFIVNRVLVALMNEAAWAVHDGEVSVGTVEATGTLELGLPMGPFELADQVGLDVVHDVMAYIHEELGDAYVPCPLIAEKVEAGDLGKKTDQGFHDYAAGDGPAVSQDARDAELADRLLAIMANEAAKLLDAEVATREAIDTAIELGAGFPDGPTSMADARGLGDLVHILEDRHAEHGATRYEPADGLRASAAAGGFHVDEDRSALALESLRIDYPGRHVGRIRIDRSHRMNAISPAVLAELPRAIDELEADEDVRAVLLMGVGDRAFSAGADIGAMASVLGEVGEAVDLSRRGQRAFGRLQSSDLPVIAAVDGYCLGGGMELATAADLRIATDRATFGQPERDLGLLPGWGGTQRLAPIVGVGRAKEIVMTGEEFDAERMEQFGFVNRVYEPDGFEEAAIGFAEEIAAGPPLALAEAKRAMNLAGGEEDAGLAVEASAFGKLTATDDLAEGVSAYLEDRDPEFTGE